MQSIGYWILAIVLFGVVLTLHEFGHFWAARLTRVGVVEFAVGFGPKIFTRKAKSGVTYSLRALPFGGYCRFVADDEDGIPDREDAYSKAKIWKRALISIAGPLMNFLTAMLLIFVLYAFIGLPIGPVPVVGGVMEGLPAAEAGFEPGDQIVSINGTPIATTNEAFELITAAGDVEIAFGIERDSETLTLYATPRWVEDEGRSMIGIEYMSGAPVRYGFVDSLVNTFQLTGRMSLMIVEVLGDLIFRGEGAENLSGPIGTVTLIKEQTQSGGLFSYLYLAATISVNLGLFNLLPVPGLDGSKLIFLAAEKVRGKRLDPNKEGMILLIGFAVMMCVMVFALYQDVVRLLQ